MCLKCFKPSLCDRSSERKKRPRLNLYFENNCNLNAPVQTVNYISFLQNILDVTFEQFIQRSEQTLRAGQEPMHYHNGNCWSPLSKSDTYPKT